VTLVNTELKMTWKEAVVMLFDVIPADVSDGLAKTVISLIRDGLFPGPVMLGPPNMDHVC
jgi:hypothetical protein